jgi:hypothetical protein
MKLCPQCNFENIRNSFYCERCGTLLPSSTAQPTKTTYTPHKQEYPLPMLEMYTPTPPPPPSPPPPLSYSFVYPEQEVVPPPSRAHSLHILGRVVLYLIGTLIASFGLFGFLTAFMSDSAAIVGFLFLFMSSIIVLVIVLLLHRSPYLRGWQRLLGAFAATGVMFVVLIAGALLVTAQPAHTGGKLSDIVYGSIIVVYGVVLAAIALW